MRLPTRAVPAAVLALALSLAMLGASVARVVAIRFEPAQPRELRGAASLVNAWADHDGDGDPDLFVGFNGAPNRLYRNDRGTLVNVAADAGIADARPTRAAAWGDYDADGDPDLLVGFAPGAGVSGASSVLRLYRNDGARFVDATADAGLAVDSAAVRQPVWLDVDADGDLDLFVAFRDRPNALYRNEGGRFTDVADSVGLADRRRTVGAVWFDHDGDGDLDAYVGNMDGDANALMRNEGDRFTDVAESLGLAEGGRRVGDAANGTVRPCAADVDGDGRLDIVTANYGQTGLFLNLGAGRFRGAAAVWGIDVDSRDDACALSDVDHDGRLDLYINGTVTGGRRWPDRLYRNAGNRFVNVTTEASLPDADHGAAWADHDGDGDEDLAITAAHPDTIPLLMRNALDPADARRSVKVRVLDARGRATMPGAEVRVFAEGSRRLIAMRLVDAGSGYDAQSDLPVHVGLPAGTARVDVEVAWPAAGSRVLARARGVRAGVTVEVRVPTRRPAAPR